MRNKIAFSNNISSKTRRYKEQIHNLWASASRPPRTKNPSHTWTRICRVLVNRLLSAPNMGRFSARIRRPLIKSNMRILQIKHNKRYLTKRLQYQKKISITFSAQNKPNLIIIWTWAWSSCSLKRLNWHKRDISHIFRIKSLSKIWIQARKQIIIITRPIRFRIGWDDFRSFLEVSKAWVQKIILNRLSPT